MPTDVDEGYRYNVDNTPWYVAQGEDIDLDPPDEGEDTRLTRRVLRWHSAEKDGVRRLSITLAHQRRSSLASAWQDLSFDLRTLPAGQEVRLELSAEQTATLMKHIDGLRLVNEQLAVELGSSFTVHPSGHVVVPAEYGALIEQLRGAADPDALAASISDVAPDIADAAALVRLHRVRSEALAEFREHLATRDWSEGDWQRFFERNDWIFGHGLDYRFLVTEQAQAHYGGADVTGSGGQEGDFLMGSAGDARFAVLVEIKKPTADLLAGPRYRNGAWRPSVELAGGIAQLQANCLQWVLASQQPNNYDWARDRDLTTSQPRGILLIGSLSDIASSREQRESFERFRRHLWNPEVLTYDELYARAEYLVARVAGAREEPNDHAAEAPDDEFQDLPF